jgi:hypothetical protein
MRVYFDERCLDTSDLARLLRSWRQASDYGTSNSRELQFYLDKNAVRAGRVLSRFNALKHDERALFGPVLFSTEFVRDWRGDVRAEDAICQLETESEPVMDCAVCEVYEHEKLNSRAALFGNEGSSFSGRGRVGVSKVEPAGPQLDVHCGCDLLGIQRIGRTWNCLIERYDPNLKRPPKDDETILGREPERFTRLGNVERNGRRCVYREGATGRLIYVDNLHSGLSAHLEVFDSNERHLGIADLDGNLDLLGHREGRVIRW